MPGQQVEQVAVAASVLHHELQQRNSSNTSRQRSSIEHKAASSE